MILKINKQKLIMEEVETFDEISIADLVEGASVLTCSRILILITEFVQIYRKMLRDLSSCLMNTLTRMGERASRSFSSIGHREQPKLGC